MGVTSQRIDMGKKIIDGYFLNSYCFDCPFVTARKDPVHNQRVQLNKCDKSSVTLSPCMDVQWHSILCQYFKRLICFQLLSFIKQKCVKVIKFCNSPNLKQHFSRIRTIDGRQMRQRLAKAKSNGFARGF